MCEYTTLFGINSRPTYIKYLKTHFIPFCKTTERYPTSLIHNSVQNNILYQSIKLKLMHWPHSVTYENSKLLPEVLENRQFALKYIII